MILALPYLSLILWAVALVLLGSSVVRLYRGPLVRKPADEWRAVVFFAACIFALFNSRRILMPEDQPSFAILYSLSIALAAYVLILKYQERPR